MPFRSEGPITCWRPSLREAFRHRFLRNPGDELGLLLTAAVLEQRGRRISQWTRPGRRMLAVGSVLQLARPGDVVWGAGLRNAELAPHLSPSIDVRAVRGPLTADALRKHAGIECSVFGDPGLLVPRLLGRPPRVAARGMEPRVLFLSHFADPREPPRSIRHLRMVGAPQRILAALAETDVVISSALHGIVLAESMGLPTVWLAGIAREPEFKFLDYFYGTGRSAPARVEGFRGWECSVNDPAVVDEGALLEAFPIDCFGGVSGRERPAKAAGGVG
jgi:pyruvyltransferase